MPANQVFSSTDTTRELPATLHGPFYFVALLPDGQSWPAGQTLSIKLKKPNGGDKELLTWTQEKTEKLYILQGFRHEVSIGVAGVELYAVEKIDYDQSIVISGA